MLTSTIPTAVGTIRRRGSIARRRLPAVLLSASALLLASAGSAAAAPTPISLNTTNWSGSAGFGSTAPGWYQDSLGIVHLEGAAKQISATPPSASVIGTLPAAARPDRLVVVIAHTFSGTYADLEIATDGAIAVIGPQEPAVKDLSFVSLEGITYQPANALPAAAITLNATNWSSSASSVLPVAAPAAYTAGPTVHLEGAAMQTSAAGPNATVLGTVPGADRPGDGTVYTIAGTGGGTYTDLAITPTGQIELIGPRPPAIQDFLFVSLEGISYARVNVLAGVAGIATNTGNWSANAGFGSASPGWYEDTGGIIHLEGALKQTSSSGPNANLVGTLPIVARPRTVYTLVHTFSGTYADLAIGTNGQITVIAPRPPAVEDLSFLSLEGITFDAPSPKFFGLAVTGTEQQGATITVILHKPRMLTLSVSAVRRHQLVNVGVVRLGSHHAGLSRIHWNLKINGRPLKTGRYQVSLHALNGHLLSVPAPPGPLTLVVDSTGHVRVQK